MLGSSLYMRSDRRDWLKIKDSSMWNMEETDGILPALRLSYKHLPSYTKRCFAFCATFPKDYLIEKEMLIQMWMAHGFIPSGERLDVKGHEIFNQLVQRSFLHDIKQVRKDYFIFANGKDGIYHEYEHNPSCIITICKMHDLVHDLAQSIVRYECTALYEGSPKVAAPKAVYHLSVSRFHDLDSKQTLKAFTNLRTFIDCPDIEKLTGNFPQYTFLRALRLQSLSFSRFSITTKFLQHLRYLELSSYELRDLPDSICTLHHLHTLDLFGCYQLRKLPESICTLLNLHTLNLCECIQLCELPERMQCMSCLRNLYLDYCSGLKKMPAGMGRMTNLQTLTMYLVGDEDGRGIEELKGLHLTSKLEIYNLMHVKDAEEVRQTKLHSKDLQRLALCWREVDYHFRSYENDAKINCLNEGNEENVLEELKPPGGIKVLEICDYKGLHFPAWMMGCLHLVQLHLEFCKRIHRLPPLWRLNSLKVLSLKQLGNLKYIISDDDDAAGDSNMQPFPSLKKLNLCFLGSLEEWWEKKNAAQAMAICFPSLVDLEIKYCPELGGSMPLLSYVKNLKLRGSNKIRLGDFVPDEKSSCRHLQRLEKLKISGCEEVALMRREMTGFGSCLKEMHVRECDWMFSSRGSGIWRCMASLERLKVSHCHASIDLFEALQVLKSLRSLTITQPLNVPEAETSIMDACLPTQLEEFSLLLCESLTTLMLRCPARLKHLRIYECPNLVSLTAADQEFGEITSLKSLIIEGCSSLKSLPECLLRCLPNLQHLSISGCPELGKKCTRGGEYWDLVSNIPDKYVDPGEGAQSSAKNSATTNFVAKCLNFLSRRR